MTEVKVIHPNPSGPTKAPSPYQRKLERIREDIRAAQAVAPELDKMTLETIIAALTHLI